MKASEVHPMPLFGLYDIQILIGCGELAIMEYFETFTPESENIHEYYNSFVCSHTESS
jgi:hypothetical protein